jgi:hypothetical protein
VVAGVITTEPKPKTEPTPWLMLKAVGLPETEKDRVAELPTVTEAGLAVKELMVGAGTVGRLKVVKVKSEVWLLCPVLFEDWALK